MKRALQKLHFDSQLRRFFGAKDDAGSKDLTLVSDPLAPYAELLRNAPDVHMPLYQNKGCNAMVNLRTYSLYHARRCRETGSIRHLKELELCQMAYQRFIQEL